jgi:hypothetical protein
MRPCSCITLHQRRAARGIADIERMRRAASDVGRDHARALLRKPLGNGGSQTGGGTGDNSDFIFQLHHKNPVESHGMAATASRPASSAPRSGQMRRMPALGETRPMTHALSNQIGLGSIAG